SHERAHLMCAYGMSPYAQGEPCYVLIWESVLGSFYHIDEQLRIHKVGDVLQAPGLRYIMLYALADETFRGRFRLEDAGKLMSLAGYETRGPLKPAERETIERLLRADNPMISFRKEQFA